MVPVYKNEVVVFDLDDSIYKEFDFLRSAYWEIAQKVQPETPKVIFKQMMAKYFAGENVFDWLQSNFLNGKREFTKEYLLNTYRTHYPNITLSHDTKYFLDTLKIKGNPIGIITDGRISTQQNKIDALKLQDYTSDIIISDAFGFQKPSMEGFLYFMKKYPANKFLYLGDNYNKDFISPNKLGWRTIGLDDNGLNIHTQAIEIPKSYNPMHVISSFNNLILTDQVL